MPATSTCFSSIQGLILRATTMDSCGRWTTGASAAVQTDGFVQVGLKATTEDGTEFVVKLANGHLSVSQKDAAVLKWLEVDITLANVDPNLLTLMAGTTPVLDYAGVAVGFEMDANLSNGKSFGLEIWTKVAGAGCGGGSYPYIYWLVPFVHNAALGDITLENAAASFTLAGTTLPNPNYGKGPWNVVDQNSGGTAGKLLSNVGSLVHLHTGLTSVAPPVSTCGYVANSVNWSAPA